MRRELQAVFAAPTAIRQWQIIGGWSQDHGQPKFDPAKAPDLKESIAIGNRNVTWKTAKAIDDNGRVSPGKYVNPDNNVWSLAYAEIESPLDHEAEFLLGSDDQAVLWINGQRLLQFTGNRGWTAEQDKGKVMLKKGTNQIYFLCGNTGGPWDFSLALRMHNPDYAFLFENVPAALDVAKYREHATKNAGNAEKGKQIFNDMKGVGCVKCHAVAGVGAKIGPDLVGIGSKYPREELIRSVLEPSNRVAESYAVTNIVTDAGQVLSGLVQSENETELDLVDAAGKVTKIKKSEIEERNKTSVSLMPNGLKDGLTLADFADVIAYLESLKQAN
jgi:putative heme-binding domain-containing protein